MILSRFNVFWTKNEFINFFIFLPSQASKSAALLGSDIRARALNGEMKLELTYNEALPCPAWCVVLSEYNASLKVSITLNKKINCITE